MLCGSTFLIAETDQRFDVGQYGEIFGPSGGALGDKQAFKVENQKLSTVEFLT